MATQLTQQFTADDAQYQAMTQHYLDEIRQINQSLVHDQQEIEQLQIETRLILADMQIVLHKIEAR